MIKLALAVAFLAVFGGGGYILALYLSDRKEKTAKTRTKKNVVPKQKTKSVDGL